MFTIDFTKPWLYKDVIYFNQGNLSTNNTLRCKLVTGGSDDFTGGSIACTFTTKDSVEISGFGKVIDAKSGIVDIVFPSNSLVVGTNRLEVLVNRADGGLAQSPPVMYDIWQGLTTGNGIEAETNYPILIQLINSTNEASNKANSALNKANSMITDITDAIDNAYRSANDADIATSNANTKIEEVETAKTEMIKKVDTSIVTMKSEVETAKNEMASKANEKIADVDRALAAGTVDLELKASRDGEESLPARLKRDLYIDEVPVKQRVLNLENMKEMQDLEYSTDKGYAVCEKTGNGTVKDLKLYGKSLVSKFSKKYTETNITVLYSGILSTSGFKVEIGKTYTILGSVKSPTKNMCDVYYLESNINIGNFKGVPLVFTANKNDTLRFVSLETGLYVLDNIMVLEGDYSQNPPQYFEGIASVGNGKPIEITTTNKNLFNESLLNDRLEEDGYYHFRSIGNNRASLFMGIVDKSNKQILSMQPNIGHDLTNIDLSGCKVLIGMNGDVKDDKLLFTITDFAIGNFSIYKGCEFEIVDANHIRVKNIYIKHGLEKGEYTPNKQEKKPVLYKDTDNTWKPVLNLRGVDENRRDMVDTSTNSYISMMREIVENGDGNWQVADGSKPNTIMFLRMFTESERCELLGNNPNLLCDRFNPKYVYSLDEEGIFINRTTESSNGGVYIRISQNKLETRDVAGFKKWLQVNNASYTYKGDIIHKYETNPIYPDSYDNETMISFGSGAIAPHASWKITSSLPNFVKELSNQIKQLQEQVYKTNVANFTVALNTLDTKLRLDRLEAPQQ